jgi:2,4-dienoyl-CoA reductase-like NADH-dependent reductase (Old Yellow Enzyme family)
MMKKYPNLFSPIQIAGHTFKNRILSAPMLFGFYALDETAERVYRIVEDRARGGAAEVIVGEVPINFTDAADAMFLGADDNYSKKEGPLFDAYKKYADIIKKHDAVANI